MKPDPTYLFAGGGHLTGTDCDDVANPRDTTQPAPAPIPRRCYLDKLTPAETAIVEAINAVEAVGADVRLTEAVILLGKAKDKVSDYVDGVNQEDEKPQGTP